MATQGMSISLKTGLLQWMFKRGRTIDNSATGGFPPSPTSVYISLHTGPLTRSGLEATASEVFGINYVRQQVPTDTNPSTHVNWYDITVSGDTVSISNKVAIQFPVAGADGWANLAPITHYAVWSALATTERAYLCAGPLTVPVTVRVGDIVRFDPNTPSGPGGLIVRAV